MAMATARRLTVASPPAICRRDLRLNQADAEACLWNASADERSALQRHKPAALAAAAGGCGGKGRAGTPATARSGGTNGGSGGGASAAAVEAAVAGAVAAWAARNQGTVAQLRRRVEAVLKK